MKCLAHTPEYRDVKFLVDSLSLRNKFVMNNTPGIKKNIIIVFVSDGCHLTFFEEPVDHHSAFYLFV
jgi:hypothetical protein